MAGSSAQEGAQERRPRELSSCTAVTTTDACRVQTVLHRPSFSLRRPGRGPAPHCRPREHVARECRLHDSPSPGDYLGAAGTARDGVRATRDGCRCRPAGALREALRVRGKLAPCRGRSSIPPMVQPSGLDRRGQHSHQASGTSPSQPVPDSQQGARALGWLKSRIVRKSKGSNWSSHGVDPRRPPRCGRRNDRTALEAGRPRPARQAPSAFPYTRITIRPSVRADRRMTS